MPINTPGNNPNQNTGVAGSAVRTADSPTNLAACPDGAFPDGSLAYVTSPASLWVLDKNSTLTVDSQTVVATRTGIGRWVQMSRRYSGTIPVTVFGADSTGGADSTTAFTNAINALNGTGITLSVPSGTYKVTAALPSTLAPTVVIEDSVTFTGSSATAALTTLAKLTGRAELPVTLFGADPTGSVDSSGEFQAAANALAGTGVSLLIPADTFKIASRIVLPSNLTIVGTAGAVLVASLPTIDHTDDLFFSQWVTNGFTAALSADIAQWSTTCQLSAAPTVGEMLNIMSSNAGGQDYSFIRTVRQVTGSSAPYTVTVDRPFPLSIASAGAVGATGLTSRPTNIHIIGNGMQITGTAERYIEILGGLQCTFSDIVFTSTSGNAGILVSLDEASVDCWGIRLNSTCNLDGGDFPEQAFVTESSEHCGYVECAAADAYQNAFGAYDACFAIFQNCRSQPSTTAYQTAGVNVWTNGLAKCVAPQIRGGIHQSLYLHTCDDAMIVGAAFVPNQAQSAVLLSATVVGTTLSACVMDRSNNGIYVTSGAKGTLITGCQIRDCQVGIYTASPNDTEIADCYIKFDTNNGNTSSCGGVECIGAVASIRDCTIDMDNASAVWPSGIYVTGTGALARINGCHVNIPAYSTGAIGISLDGSGSTSPKMHVADTTVTGSGAQSYGLNLATGNATLRIGPRVDVDSCTTPINNGGGYLSRTATITANGAGTAQSIAWPDAKSTDRVTFRMTTKAGTPTPYPPPYTITSGTGFSVTFAASDTSTYEYVVQ